MNKEGIKFSKKEDILEKIEVNGTGNTFFTLKDHKKKFHKPSYCKPHKSI